MSIDLTKLIAKKTYLVPIKASELCDKVLAEVVLNDSAWIGETKRGRSASFGMDWATKTARFLLLSEGKPQTEENIALKRTEYEAGGMRSLGQLNSTQEAMLDNLPVSVSYIVVEERVDGCIIKTTSKPILYTKVVRGLSRGESDLQDVVLRGEEFLDEIFIGGLGGKEMQEVKEVSRWELLINNTRVRQITERIYEMLSKATTCVLFFGWFGTECIPKFKELKDAGLTIKAMTHKPSERKAPVPEEMQKGYTELIGLLGLNNVSINPLVHGRAIIVDNKALVGSMDLNAFSLSGEHIEFAIYTEDPSTVRSLRA